MKSSLQTLISSSSAPGKLLPVAGYQLAISDIHRVGVQLPCLIQIAGPTLADDQRHRPGMLEAVQRGLVLGSCCAIQ